MKKMNRGQSIVEVLVALAIGVIVVSAITIAGLNSLNNAQYGRDQTLATKYAQEGIEVVKNVSKKDLTGFKKFGSNSLQCYCMSYQDTQNATFSAYPTGSQCQSTSGDNCCNLHCASTSTITPNINCDPDGTNCKFIRQVKIKQDASASQECGASGLAEATVMTLWTDSKCPAANPYCHSVQVTSCINAETVPTP